MRRLVVICCALLLVAASSAAAGVLTQAPNNGTLVVRNADNGDGVSAGARAVVTVVIHGFVIGSVRDQGRIRIFDLDPTDQTPPEVTGALSHRDVSRVVDGQQQTGTEWSGTNFRFRAVDGTYRVVIWGSGVYLFASGDQGQVWFTGNADATTSDGTYSLDGGDWRSLPIQGTKDIAPPVTG
jgi:hypothetical protein